jgi:hypothetical protein
MVIMHMRVMGYVARLSTIRILRASDTIVDLYSL